MSRTASTAGILGVITGTCLEKGGMGGIQDAMDVLYPGIMTAGCAAMAKEAAAELRRQFPALAELADKYPCAGSIDNCDRLVAEATATFGERLMVSGPVAAP